MSGVILCSACRSPLSEACEHKVSNYDKSDLRDSLTQIVVKLRENSATKIAEILPGRRSP